jgi:hypothetical protein
VQCHSRARAGEENGDRNEGHSGLSRHPRIKACEGIKGALRRRLATVIPAKEREKIGALAANSVVMARLDRAIQEKNNALNMSLDGRSLTLGL